MRAGPAVIVASVLAILAGGCISDVRTPPGILAPEAPVQKRLTAAPVFQVGTYVIRPVARFQVEARVLSTQRYRLGREADLSPVDFAVGWGPMSDQAVLDQIDISQGGRFYRWRANSRSIPRQDIISHSANMHLIPADASVREDLLAVRAGDLVTLQGYLVVASAPDGWRWKSSMTRSDTGNGACELVWVEQVVAYPPGFETTGF